jgi:hypothetical protein
MKRIAEVATQCLQATQQSLIAFLDIDKIPEPITPEGVGVHGADPIA